MLSFTTNAQSVLNSNSANFKTEKYIKQLVLSSSGNLFTILSKDDRNSIAQIEKSRIKDQISFLSNSAVYTFNSKLIISEGRPDHKKTRFIKVYESGKNLSNPENKELYDPIQGKKIDFWEGQIPEISEQENYLMHYAKHYGKEKGI